MWQIRLNKRATTDLVLIILDQYPQIEGESSKETND